jgi:hypothetical protein
MTNPDPEHITEPMWRLWTERPNPHWLLSGIYANKKAYHNTVNANLRFWPGNYSIKLPLDLVPENRNKARAIDLTMSDSEMVLWTKRMKTAAENPLDTRLAAVKEFFGTIDGKTVFGLGKDNKIGPWRKVTADKTHLWHGHTSIFTAFVNNWSMLAPIISVWRGDSFIEWSQGKVQLPKKGDAGESVRYWQYVHNEVRHTVTPPSPVVSVDGDYGPTSAAAFADFWKKKGGVGTFNGSYMTAWLAMQYHKSLAIVSSSTTPLPETVIKSTVEKWLESHMPNSLMLSGDIKGKVTWL